MQNFLLILPIESGIIKAVQKHAPVCRNGRRGGLKIPCANNTCGFDPHHRHKKGTPPACLGEFLFYLRRVSGSNSTALPSRASDQPCGLSLSARETPTTGIKRSSLSLSGGVLFLSAACDHDLVVCIGRDRHAGLLCDKQTLKRCNSASLRLLPHRRSRPLCHTFRAFRHKQDSTLVAEQTTIFSVYIFLRVNI